MKILTRLLLITTVFLVAACNKENIKQDINTTLPGKWKLTENLADPGDGSGKWMPVPKKNPLDYVEFKQNGELEGTVFNEYANYTIKDSITITFIKKDKSIQNYAYRIKNGALEMSPAGPVFCIERCGSRFTKLE